MRQYSKEFKEQALKLSDEIGLRKNQSNWELIREHYPVGGKHGKEETVKNQHQTALH